MKEMRQDLIAPCGMNCRLCYRFQREKDSCNGCRNESDIIYVTKGSRSCVIKNCPELKNCASGFCSDCVKFPCARLKQLDRRYTAKYQMSMLENLQAIRSRGLDDFLAQEEKKWSCASCGSIVCVHKKACIACKSEFIPEE